MGESGQEVGRCRNCDQETALQVQKIRRDLYEPDEH
jgi:hypothetical protein